MRSLLHPLILGTTGRHPCEDLNTSLATWFNTFAPTIRTFCFSFFLCKIDQSPRNEVISLTQERASIFCLLLKIKSFLTFQILQNIAKIPTRTSFLSTLEKELSPDPRQSVILLGVLFSAKEHLSKAQTSFAIEQ